MTRLSGVRRTSAIFRLALSFVRDGRKIARAKRRLSDSEFRVVEEEIYRQGGLRFRDEALQLGGLIIKVGQFLSARTDVLPLAFTRELAILQDRVPAAPWPDVQTLMESMWGQPLDALFQEVNPEPVAAASLGQVHRGVLKDGRVVALKVQRPGIENLARIDLSALRTIMRVLERRTRVGRRLNALRLFEEFQSLVREELDYRIEEAHQLQFAANFHEDSRVAVPAPLPSLTRQRVLVMDFVQGTKLTDAEELRAQGFDGAVLADLLIQSYLKQIAIDGFVQLDPHPGNFLADASGRLVFLDFGMMGEIPAQDLRQVAALLRALLIRDARAVVEAIDGLGFIRPGASPRLMIRAVQLMVDQLSGVPLTPGPALDRAVADFQDFLYQEPLQFPARYMFLGRAIGMLFGLISTLDPGLDWMGVLRKRALPILNARQHSPWVEQFGHWARVLLGSEAGNMVQTGVALGLGELREMATIPGKARRVLTRMEEGSLETNPELTPLYRKMDGLSEINRALVLSLWAGLSLALGFTLHRIWPHTPGFLLGGAVVAALTWVSAGWSLRRARSAVTRRGR